MRRAVVAVVMAQIGVAVAGVAQPQLAHAQASVEVMLNADGQQMAQDMGVTVAELVADAEARIDELYRVSRVGDLLRSFANTAAFAQRALGVDYAVDPGDVMVGFAAAGVKGDVAIGTTNEFAGSVVSFAAMAGVNLGRWKQPRWTVFGGGWYEETTVYGLSGHLLTLGAHVQYQVLPATRRARARWTGLAATTGLEYARWTIGMASSLESHFTAEGPLKTYTVHMSSVGTLDVLSSTINVPLEVTTGVRFFNVLGLYAGGGLSLTTGDATISTALNSTLSITANRLPVGTAIITGTGTNTPDTVNVHGLAGFEVHTRHVRVFLQGVLSPGDTTSVSLGLRAVL